MSDQITTDEGKKKGRKGKKAAEWADAAAEGAQAQADAAEPERFHDVYEIKLTEAEIALKAKELAGTFAQIEALEEKKTAAANKVKAEIALVESLAKDLAKAITSGTEERSIEVYEKFVFATNTAEIRRADTHELLGKRALTPAERQPTLPLSEARSDLKDAIDGIRGKDMPGTQVSVRGLGAAEATDVTFGTQAGDDPEAIDQPQSMLDGFADDSGDE